jgi:hypothetical protein
MAGNRTVSGQLLLQTQFTLRNTLQEANSKTSSTQVGFASLQRVLTSGVSANEANRAWELEDYTLTAGNDVTINLNTFAGWNIGAGVGNDGVGLAMDLEEIVLIIVRHISGDGQLEIYPGIASPWTPIGSHLAAQGGALTAGGVLLKMNTGEAGFDVIGGTSENIDFKAVGGDVTFSVTIVGRNDDDESSSSSSLSSSSSGSSSSSSNSSSSGSSESSLTVA